MKETCQDPANEYDALDAVAAGSPKPGEAKRRLTRV